MRDLYEEKDIDRLAIKTGLGIKKAKQIDEGVTEFMHNHAPRIEEGQRLARERVEREAREREAAEARALKDAAEAAKAGEPAGAAAGTDEAAATPANGEAGTEGREEGSERSA